MQPRFTIRSSAPWIGFFRSTRPRADPTASRATMTKPTSAIHAVRLAGIGTGEVGLPSDPTGSRDSNTSLV
jgi:hypothetical protein